ncbi:MAG: hypothetical protein ABGW50_07910, partial [Thermococcus sp.]
MLSLFNFLKCRKKEDEDEERRRKPRRHGRENRRKSLASMFIMLLLISSTFSAGYAAAWPWDSAVKKVKHAVDTVKNNLLGLTGGTVAGMYVGAAFAGLICEAASFGACTPLLLATFGIAGAASGVKGEQWLKDKLFGSSSSSDDNNDNTAVYTQAQNATTDDLTKDTDTLQNTAKALDDTQQAAYKQIAELNAVLRSDLTKYDISETGATGDLWAEVYAPQKVYGFSAFPVQVKLYTKESNIPFSVVHIRSVKVYLKEENSSVPLWTRTWDYGAGSEGLNGEDVVYSTVLKVPDPYQYQVKQMVNSGQVNKGLIMEIFNNASTKAWEIFVDIDAYR